MIRISLNNLENDVDKTFKRLLKENIVERIWKKDHTVWSEDPTEITNRLGWLVSPTDNKKCNKRN